MAEKVEGITKEQYEEIWAIVDECAFEGKTAEFVESLRAYHKKHKYLSQRQWDALERILAEEMENDVGFKDAVVDQIGKPVEWDEDALQQAKDQGFTDLQPVKGKPNLRYSPSKRKFLSLIVIEKHEQYDTSLFVNDDGTIKKSVP